MYELGFADAIIYGRGTEVNGGNIDFTVTWDIDGQVLKHMTLEKVKLESRDRPKQIAESSVIKTYDFQTAEQCSSRAGALTHALLIEDFDVANENESYYLLANNKKCFKATMYSTEPGALVHNKELLDPEGKFRIDEVLDDTGRALMKICIVKAAFLHEKWIKPHCKKTEKLMNLPKRD